MTSNNTFDSYNNNGGANLHTQRSSLIDFEAFGTPKRTNERLKKLKGQLQLYNALDALEFQTQDRRFWRRPNTFSIGHADRKSQFDDGESTGIRVDGNDDPLGVIVASGRKNTKKQHQRTTESSSSSSPRNHNQTAQFEAGPRGILKALSHATSNSLQQKSNAVPISHSASPVPFPPGFDQNNAYDHHHHPSSLSNLYQQQRQTSLTIQSIEEEKAANEQAAHISELELRKVRKEYRELVAKQRAEEEAVLIPMFEAERQAEEARSQKSKVSSVHGNSDENNNNGKKTNNKNSNQVVELFGHKFPVNNNAVSTPRKRPNTSIVSSPRQRTVTTETEVTQTFSSSARRPGTSTTTTVQFKPAPPAPPATATTSARSNTSSSTPDHLHASRVRVLQFNAYRSNGITGISRQPNANNNNHNRPNTEAHRAATASASFTAADFFTKKREFRSIQEAEEAEELEAMMMKRREEEMLSHSPKTAYSMSAHPALRRDTVSKMYAMTADAEAEIEAAENQMKQSEKDIVDSNTLFSARNNLNNQQHHNHQQNQQQQTEDPKIEVNDPFAFLDESKFQSLNTQTAAASTKKNYNLTLQEKILSLAAARAGVSLSAAAAPGRLLGLRQPTAEAEQAHELSLEELDRLERKKALAAAAKNQSANRRRNPQHQDENDSHNHGRQVGNGAGSLQGVNNTTNKNNNNNNAASNSDQQQQSSRDAQEVREGVMRRQMEFKAELEKRRNAIRKGKYCQEAPLPFGCAGPNEKHIPSPRIHPPAANNGRQERNLCDNVHMSSRTPGAGAYRPAPQQFAIPTWKKINSLRGFANAGLAPSVSSWQ